VGGHSAGAQLAARIALDVNPLSHYGLSPAIIKGAIAVSGAGFDLRDEQTYTLGRNLYLYEDRFRCGDPTDAWKTDASPICFINPAAPPFLIIHSEGDPKALQRQSNLMHTALRKHGTESQLVRIPGENHCRMVLALSRADKAAAPAIQSFVQKFSAAPQPPLREIAAA
jgi:dipeptidyl aminopeptidase/acylaminoacyl peptidase